MEQRYLAFKAAQRNGEGMTTGSISRDIDRTRDLSRLSRQADRKSWHMIHVEKCGHGRKCFACL